MKISSKVLLSSINKMIFEWQKCGLVLSSRNHRAFPKADGTHEVTWGNDGFILKNESFASLEEYCALVENRQYSMLLMDGSFFQLSFTLKRDRIIKHRLCWYPSPLVFENFVAESVDLISVILDTIDGGDIGKFKLRSPVRFDYSPTDARIDHPAVHLHICNESCRIPVKTPLCLRKFMQFIVENFYEEILPNSALHKDTKTWRGKDLLTEEQKTKFHLHLQEAT